MWKQKSRWIYCHSFNKKLLYILSATGVSNSFGLVGRMWVSELDSGLDLGWAGSSAQVQSGRVLGAVHPLCCRQYAWAPLQGLPWRRCACWIQGHRDCTWPKGLAWGAYCTWRLTPVRSRRALEPACRVSPAQVLQAACAPDQLPGLHGESSCSVQGQSKTHEPHHVASWARSSPWTGCLTLPV